MYQYDPVGRLTMQVDSNSGGTALVTFVDGYDAVGNRTSRVKDGVAPTWVYDAAYRLTNQQKSGQAATFVHDNAGNITLKHHEGSNPLTMSYDAGNRITTSILGSSQLTTFTHDANGNMTGERCDYLSVLTTYVYDGENRCLNELRGSGAHHTYTYAPDGLRRSAHHGGGANPVSFVWDGDDLLNEYRLGGVSYRYDVLEGEVFGERRDASRYLYVPDPLGSVNHLLDTSQTIAGTTTYFPYGEVHSHTGPDTPLQFVGGLGYHTGVVNRAYVRARWYRPDLGRWLGVRPGYPGQTAPARVVRAPGPARRGQLSPQGTFWADGLEQAALIACTFVFADWVKNLTWPLSMCFDFHCVPCSKHLRQKCWKFCNQRHTPPCTMVACVSARLRALWIRRQANWCLCFCPAGNGSNRPEPIPRDL